MRDILKFAQIPKDDELLGELTVRKYRIHPGTQRLMIDSKEHVRENQKKQGLILRSPDKADALCLCFYDAKRKKKSFHQISTINIYDR